MNKKNFLLFAFLSAAWSGSVNGFFSFNPHFSHNDGDSGSDRENIRNF